MRTSAPIILLFGWRGTIFIQNLVFDDNEWANLMSFDLIDTDWIDNISAALFYELALKYTSSSHVNGHQTQISTKLCELNDNFKKIASK